MKVRNNDLSDRRIDIDIAAEFQSTYINASMTSLSSSFCLYGTRDKECLFSTT